MPIPNASQVSGPIKEIGKEDILLELNEPDEVEKEEILEEDKEPIKEKKKEVVKEEVDKEEVEEEEEEPEIDELEEIEKDLKDVDDEELELITPVSRAAILKKYPNLFKDFPYMEKAYYREKQFTEVFSTPADAKEASEKAQTLDKFETELLEGDLTNILSAVKDEDKSSFGKLADNYLVALSKVDETAYHHVVGNIIKSTIYNMIKEAETSDENTGKLLKNTAHILNQYVFGTAKFTAPSKFSKEDSPEKSEREIELDRREENFKKQRFESARDSLDKKVDNRLKSIIKVNIDPKESMTEYIRDVAGEKVLNQVWSKLEKEPRFKNLKDKLWENAFKNDYDSNSMGKIETAIISMAKTLLPTVIKRARIEALKGMGKRVNEKLDDNEENNEIESGEAPKRRESTSQQKSRQIVKKGEIPAGMSSKDYIMSD